MLGRPSELKKKLEKIFEGPKGVVLYIIIGVLVTRFLVPSNHLLWYSMSMILAPLLYITRKYDWTPYIYGGMAFAASTYFLMGVVLATKLPVVTVSSGSMDHGINSYGYPCKKIVQKYTETFDNWWNLCGETYKKFGITKEEFQQFPFNDGLKIGDILVISNVGEYGIGDVIVYDAGQSRPIIHRIVMINQDGTFQTKGDHNYGQNYYERSISRDQIYGKATLRIPRIGYLRVMVGWLGV